MAHKPGGYIKWARDRKGEFKLRISKAIKEVEHPYAAGAKARG